MAEPQIRCWQCRTYDREARRCRIGKANPKTKRESITVAELLGAQVLCLHNPHREPLILRMRFPDRPIVWSLPAPRRPAPLLEIEVLDEEQTSGT